MSDTRLTLKELKKQVEQMRETFKEEHPSSCQNWLLAFDEDDEPVLVNMNEKEKVE